MSIRIELLKLADAIVGRGISMLFGLGGGHESSRGSAPSEPPSRVLVIRPGGIGDAVLFVPMLRALREAWPDTEIELLMERRNVAVIASTGLADRIYLYDRVLTDLVRVLRRPYDVVIDTEQYHHFSALMAWVNGAPRRIGFATTRRRYFLTEQVRYSQTVYEARSFLDLAEVAIGRKIRWDSDQPFYPVAQDAADDAEKTLVGFEGMPLVAIHPGASIPERRWAPARYGTLARLLAERGAAIIVLGGPTDRRAAAVICQALGEYPHVNLAGRCTLPEAAAFVRRAWVYVSADTGVLHLAYGVGTPTVHIFGPGVLAKWGPPGKRFRTVEKALPCSPCTRYGYTPPCNQGQLCMRKITPEQLLDVTWEQLESTGEMTPPTVEDL